MAVTTDPLGPLLHRPVIADAVERARQAVDALLANRTLARRPAAVAAELSLQAAWASAVLDGSPLSLAEVRAESPSALADPLLQGALRVQAELPGLAATWHRAPRQALAHLHVLAAADLVSDSGHLGRPRAAALDRLDTLAAVLDATTAPALIVAAIVHGELLALDAFPPAAGVLARGAARLTLVDRGLDPLALTAIEVGHHALAPAYQDALAAYRTGTADGLDRWLAHAADAVEVAVRAALAAALAPPPSPVAQPPEPPPVADAPA